jgi:amino-acid N-acetyltransferase
MAADAPRAAATDPLIDRARTEDLPAVLSLLAANRLPQDGIAPHVGTAIVARSGGDVVGSAALEPYADGVLLRSVAVAPERHGQGLGHRLVAAALDLARTLGAPAVYLLTTTADTYFPAFGFERIARADVPPSVQTSIEFTSACPSSAVVMRRLLS